MNKNINFGAQGLKLTNIIITGRPNIDKSMRIYYDDESNITIPFNIAKRDKHSHLTLTERIALQLRNFEVSNHPDAIKDAGIAYAIDQIVDLVTHGVSGIHLYTMNNPHVARKIYEATKSLFDVAPIIEN